MNKKSIKILGSLALTFALFAPSTFAFADTSDNSTELNTTISEDLKINSSNVVNTLIGEDLKTKVIPYQQLVDKLNSELGSNIKIPEDKETYEKIISVSLEDTERDLRQAYQEAKAMPDEITLNETNITKPSLSKISPKAIRKSVHQKKDYSSSLGIYVQLEGAAEYYTVTASYGEYRYLYSTVSLVKSGSGSYFSPTIKFTNVYSNQQRYCNVNAEGTMMSSSGYDLCVYKKFSCQFDAQLG